MSKPIITQKLIHVAGCCPTHLPKFLILYDDGTCCDDNTGITYSSEDEFINWYNKNGLQLILISLEEFSHVGICNR